jgi:putative aldouronate transport system permease protein
MALPVVLYYIVFHYGPLYGAIIAFKQFDIGKGIWGSPWVGFKHFTDFFSSFYFARLMRNTLFLSLMQLAMGFPVPIILALLLNEVRHKRFKSIVQTSSYLPHFISTVVVCGMIVDFCARDGLITNTLVALGMERTNLLTQPEYFRAIYVFSGIWQEAGWGTIIYLAALAGIDSELYEAAQIDGANRFRQLISITMPSIMPTVVIMLLLNIGRLMSLGFEKIILLYNPNTYETADIISSFVYRKGLGEGFQLSFTTAVGLFSSTINFALIVFANRLSRQVNETSLW